MPAIDLARLKTQAARLSEKFGEPEAFLHGLRELLDLYTNRTVRSAQIAQRLSLPTYRTPRPVLRQIESELEPLADAHPLEAVTLTDALWKARFLEARLLAAHLIGSIPPPQAMSVLTSLPELLRFSTDKEIRHALLTKALARIRRENPEGLLFLLEDWLKLPNRRLQAWGLQALIPLLNDPHFEDLPVVFRIIRPAVETASPSTQLELRDCLAALEHISVTETVYFLREIVVNKPNPMLLRTLQRILPAFSPELQAGLREVLRPIQGG